MTKNISASRAVGKKLKQQQNHKYWSEMISKYHSSGQTQKQFCTEHGLSYTTFKNWVHRIKKHATQKTESGKFIGVKLTESASETKSSMPIVPFPPESPKRLDFSHVTQTSPVPDLQIKLPSNCIITVPRGFDDETLRRVVKVMN